MLALSPVTCDTSRTQSYKQRMLLNIKCYASFNETHVTLFGKESLTIEEVFNNSSEVQTRGMPEIYGSQHTMYITKPKNHI